MGGLFSSNEHAENIEKHAKNIKKAKEKFEQQQRILNANMLVNKLRREGYSTDDIAHKIMAEYEPNVYKHISNEDVRTKVEEDYAELWIYHW
tara:strand:+ start:172 stop:447 length:276 start_codon:yes stop_codon:yes gene_type:complete